MGTSNTVGRHERPAGGDKDRALLVVRGVRSLRPGQGYDTGMEACLTTDIDSAVAREVFEVQSRYRGLQKLQGWASVYQARQKSCVRYEQEHGVGGYHSSCIVIR